MSLISEIKALEYRNSSGVEYKVLSVLSYGIAFANIPLSVALVLSFEVAAALKNNQGLKSAKMPDKWLNDVSESKDISKEGLAFLGKRLSKKGFISVHDALKWRELEESIATKKEENKEFTEKLAMPGAVKLLERVKSDCDGLFTSGVGFLKGAIERFKIQPNKNSDGS